MEIYYFWFFLFAVAAYFIVTDESVAKLVHYTSMLLKFQFEKTKWWLIYNPKTPWARYLMWKRSLKLAKELEKQLKSSKKIID